MSLILTHIADCKHKGKDICVFRDQHGKYHIKIDGITTQKSLLANATVRWFCNAIHESHNQQISDGMLRKQSDEFLKSGKRIEAIVYVRKHRPWGLKRALDYTKLSKYY